MRFKNIIIILVFIMEYKNKLPVIGDAIKKARKEKGITQEDLLERLRCTGTNASIGRNSLSALENGNTEGLKIRINTLYEIGKILDVDLDYFLGITDFKKYEHKEICEYTGLTEDAITTLRDFPPELKPLLSQVIVSEHFLSFIETIFTIHLWSSDSQELMFLIDQDLAYLEKKNCIDDETDDFITAFTECLETIDKDIELMEYGRYAFVEHCNNIIEEIIPIRQLTKEAKRFKQDVYHDMERYIDSSKYSDEDALGPPSVGGIVEDV